jgi:RimJ/RimL family protein N-acetyltransferase
MSGTVKSEASVELKLFQGGPCEITALQRVLEEAPQYTYRLTGRLPEPGDAQNLFDSCPAGKTRADKFVFAISFNGHIIGCADVVRGYPEQDTAMIGLLLLSEQHHRQGTGRTAYTRLEAIIRSWGQCHKIRIGVVRTNEAVLPFWQKLGFVPTGERKPYRYEQVESETIVLEKVLYMTKAG